MIKIDVIGAHAVIRSQEPLTKGMLGAAVEFRFDEQWDDLQKTAVFKAGNVVKDTVGIDTTAVIPTDVLQMPGAVLHIGVYGVNAEDMVAIPTVWAKTDPIRSGADPEGDETADPALPVWSQVQTAAEKAVAVTENPPKISGNSTWLVFNGVTGLYEDTGISAVGPQGDKGDKGDKGSTLWADIEGKPAVNPGTGEDAVVIGYGAATGDYSVAEGHDTYAVGKYSHAEGGTLICHTIAGDSPCYVKATGEGSHAEGLGSWATGRASHAEGGGIYCDPISGIEQHVVASGDCSHAEGSGTTASGTASHAEGGVTEASGECSHAEGSGAMAYGKGSHAEGELTEARGDFSHAEGGSGAMSDGSRSGNTVATGKCSHAEGRGSTASGLGAHAEGLLTVAEGRDAHAEGQLSTASGSGSHAEGYQSKTYANNSHAEGNNTVAGIEGEPSEAVASHAEGKFTIASGEASHAEGIYCKARSKASHAEGYYTLANEYWPYVHVQGKYNSETYGRPWTSDTMAHVVGNGAGNDSRSNAHSLDWKGNAWFCGEVSGTGADYAEYFEWADGNPNNEDRVGLIVALDGDKIRPANSGDDILGVVSGTAMVVGDNAEWEWQGKYLCDDYGRVIWEMVEEFDNEGESIGFFPHRQINPDYDPKQEYVRRVDRSEWDTVGLVGKLHVTDDGSCAAGGYAAVGENGIATASIEKTNMRVMKRITDSIVLVFMK